MVPIARLHLITPATAHPELLPRIDRALDAGASWVQARRKHGTDRDRLEFVREVARICAARAATCVVDDRVDLAAATGAGVHVGAEDLPVDVARTLLGAHAIVGATCRNADDARRARDAGASYLGVGPVYATTTKDGLPDPIGLAGLEAVAAAVDLPVIAISGITVERVAAVLAAGAHGVAVVGAVFGSDDVAGAVRRLLDALGEHPIAREQAS